MPDDAERFYRGLDLRYAPDRRRITLARVTDAVDVTSYTIRFEDATGNPISDPIPGVKALLAKPIPIVGDLVRVELAGDDPLIVGVLGRAPIAQMDGTAGTAGTGSATFVTSGSTGDIINQDMVAGQAVEVIVSSRSWHTLGVGHGAVLSFRVTGAESYGPVDDDGTEIDDSISDTCSRSTIFVATVTGAHDFTLMYRAINGATANFVNRRIVVRE